MIVIPNEAKRRCGLRFEFPDSDSPPIPGSAFAAARKDDQPLSFSICALRAANLAKGEFGSG